MIRQKGGIPRKLLSHQAIHTCGYFGLPAYCRNHFLRILIQRGNEAWRVLSRERKPMLNKK